MISEIQLGSDAYTHCLTGMQEACELQRQANLDMAAPLVKETRAYSDERRVCVCVCECLFVRVRCFYFVYMRYI
jgi:hypothetical protein